MEFILCRYYLGVNWDVAYRGFAFSQGYHRNKQLMYIRSGKGHHRTFDDLSRYVDGICDELLLAYVQSSPGEKCVKDFLEWLEKKRDNLTVRFLGEQCLHYGLGIQLYRRGMRFNCEKLAILGWQLCVPLVHCRNHPKYQLLDVLNEIDRASQPAELQDLLSRNFAVSR